jgi:hypothetical protein
VCYVRHLNDGISKRLFWEFFFVFSVVCFSFGFPGCVERLLNLFLFFGRT